MVSFGELVIVISFLWLILIAIANRVDLQQYGLLVSSGFLLYVPDRFSRWVLALAEKKGFWHRFGRISLFPTLVLFLSVPLLMIINLIQGFFFSISPVLSVEIIEIFRMETFLLILPALAIVLSFQLVISTIYDLIGGQELHRAGVLLVGIVVALFATTKKSTENLTDKDLRLKSISVLVVINLLLVLVSIPLGIGIQSGLGLMYEESQGAVITTIIPGSPAAESNLQENDILLSLSVFSGNLVTFQTNISSASHLNRILSRIESTTLIVLKTPDEQISIRGITPPEGADLQTGSYLGIRTVDYHPPKIGGLSPLLPLWTELFFDWLKNVALLLGIYTLLPLPKTAGYTLMEELIKRLDLDIPQRAQQIISGLMGLVFAANIIYYVV